MNKPYPRLPSSEGQPGDAHRGLGGRDGVTLVPLQIHFNDRGMAKVLLGLGQGRTHSDKRHAIAARDWQRDKTRLMREKG